MSIFVTGGAGFIGSNFIINWIFNENEPVVNLDKLTYAGNIQNLETIISNPRHIFIRGDICDIQLVHDLLIKYKPRAVFHFAAESHVDRSIHSPDDFIQTNIIGTFRLLEAIRSYWQQLDGTLRTNFRFINVSTDEVFGSLTPGAPPFCETSRYFPNSPYSASKAASDHLVRAYFHTYGIPTLTTNCSNNYGPFQFPEKLIPLTLHNALSGAALPLYGDGQQIRDWLYVKDHCCALIKVLTSGLIGEAYNIGGKCEKTNLSVVTSICHLLDELYPRVDGKSYQAQIRFVTDRPGHDRRYAIDCVKIERELGWKAEETFETGLYKTVCWYLKNQTWVRNVTTGTYRQWLDKQYGEYT